MGDSKHSQLEIADEVRDALSNEALRQATEAFEAGEALCEICKRPLEPQAGEGGALIAILAAARTAAVLAHPSCQRSQVMYVEGEQPDPRHLDTVRFDWHAVVRRKTPGAVFMWETLTHIHGTEGDLQLDILLKLGFRHVTGTLETLSAPRAELRSFYRPNAFCFSLNGRELRPHEPFAPGIWTARAASERRVIAVYGTNLRLSDFDPDHVNARIEKGVVVAATLRFDPRFP